MQLYLLKLQFEAGKHTERDMQRNRKIYIISGSYMIPKNLVNILKALFHTLKTLILSFFIEIKGLLPFLLETGVVVRFVR